MNYYIVRRPDGHYYEIEMHDEMDAIWNENLGTPIDPVHVDLGDEETPEVFEVVKIGFLSESYEADSLSD